MPINNSPSHFAECEKLRSDNNADQQLELLPLFQHWSWSQSLELWKPTGATQFPSNVSKCATMPLQQRSLAKVEDGRDGGNPEFDGEVTDQYTAEVRLILIYVLWWIVCFDKEAIDLYFYGGEYYS